MTAARDRSPSADQPRSSTGGAAPVWVRGAPGRRAATRADDTLAFHRGLPGYRPTPLVADPRLARELGVGRVFVKDESDRFGLPAFKTLGVSWAVSRLLEDLVGGDLPWGSWAELRAAAAPAADHVLLSATAGNHGRALARVARWLGMPALILVPADASDAAVRNIDSEGATVRRAAGGYDAAVEDAAQLADGSEEYLLVQDTAWEGYERVPEAIVQGYSTLFCEADLQLAAADAPPPDLLAVPVGVGSLMTAAVRHAARRGSGYTAVASVEPETAACLWASLSTGTQVIVPTSTTVIEALNAGALSSTAWPVLRDEVDAAVTVTDELAVRGRSRLHDAGVSAGICGGATLAGVTRLLAGRPVDAGTRWGRSDATVLVISTDGS
jgi:diaminopropionate ammonia-lyase